MSRFIIKSVLGGRSSLSKVLQQSSIRMQTTSASSVSDKAAFPGYKGEFSTSLDFIYPENSPQIQCYRVMNRKGVLLDANQDPQV
jgi:hypothetical protein